MCILKRALSRVLHLQEQREDLASTEAAMVSRAIRESVQDSSPEVIDLSENEMLVYHLILWECPLLATGDYFQCFQL